MRKRLLLLAMTVAMSLTWSNRLSAQDFCPAMVGMSICDESEWAVYAQCWYDLAYQMCMDIQDPPKPTQAECVSEANRIYWLNYDSETDTCQQVIAECRLQGGTFNWENYHCDLPPCPPGGGGDGGGGTGGGGSTGGGGGGECEEGQLVTVEDCEDLCGGIADEDSGECIVAMSIASGIGLPSAGSPIGHRGAHRADLIGSSLGRGTTRWLFSPKTRGLREPLVARHYGGGQQQLKTAPKQDDGGRQKQ